MSLSDDDSKGKNVHGLLRQGGALEVLAHSRTPQTGLDEMIIGAEWIGMALVLGGLWAFGSSYMRLGFILQLLSAVAWTIVASSSALWGLLVLQGGIAYLAVRGLWRHRHNGSKTTDL